ncbi:uncharacterized protein LOC114277868 isoform X2 [Camellia sinensis]|uniref:uncharacterized protein LOC114277868 isoform X2 n=1 Tax=Camellia sinensis TaxID=4442 RepID=UPI0010369384|nr:uncharacterized protein LOC114277868 isoform X2 [Camellia sinensis]XP_028075644.1 uncharacterized protein LOC114277868 isoform X2 [Camellia sinensis]XP_028075650.1 uncharacterized protein LOC114277868 isoform X2 [Camellia sinensis]XP_028075658.1 uncharacterized protein LOC114277868 isoform X2 [Camellia sinensis]
MSAGLLFGSIIGTIIVSISGTVAASVAFLIARYFARDRILKLAEGNKKFLAIDKAIGENGFRVVTFLRLSPLLPFSLGNYLYGLTSVKFVPYVLGRFASCIYLWERAKKNLFGSNLQICMEATTMISKFVDVLKFLDHFLIPRGIFLSLSRWFLYLYEVSFVMQTRNATGLVAPAIAVGLGALTYTLGTLVPVVGASGFATAAIATVIGTVVSSFR